jgi:hypothetical protein
MKTLKIKQRLMALAAITEEQYAVMVWELGNEYALHLLGDVHVADKLSGTGTYWDWWTNQWQIADAAFMNLLDCYSNKPSSAALLEMWKAEHQPERIRMFPGAYVFKAVKTRVKQ